MTAQTDFLRNEFWILSWNASVQRALRYNTNRGEADRAAFRQHLADYCDSTIMPRYAVEQSEAQHVVNILRLRDAAASYPDQDLLATPYNIGIAQKLLNLQLKYLWCTGMIGMPPHCPIDRIILEQTGLKGKMNWTRMASISDYEDAIEAAREVAGGKPLALWELEMYQRKR